MHVAILQEIVAIDKLTEESIIANDVEIQKFDATLRDLSTKVAKVDERLKQFNLLGQSSTVSASNNVSMKGAQNDSRPRLNPLLNKDSFTFSGVSEPDIDDVANQMSASETSIGGERSVDDEDIPAEKQEERIVAMLSGKLDK